MHGACDIPDLLKEHVTRANDIYDVYVKTPSLLWLRREIDPRYKMVKNSLIKLLYYNKQFIIPIRGPRGLTIT